jgi:2-methylcitrate dehydratase PrpD
MLGASPDQIRHAAGIGEYHGPRSQMMRCIDFPTMVRDGVGWGAPSGVVGAYLAREGFTGAPALTCESEAGAPFWADLGENWLTIAHTHYKLYPCCRWAHPSMQSAAILMQQHDLMPSDVASVEIKTFHYATRLAGHRPETLDDLSYAIAFPVAAMIVRGQFGAAELTLETLKDPEILRISTATTLIEDPELTARSVDKRWAQVTLVLSDGRRVEAPPNTPRGDADDPLSDAEITAKFHGLADPAIGQKAAKQLFELCLKFDELDAKNFGTLLEMLATKDFGR